ncbi:MAG: amidohydrolase family protein [Alphaproteobacteria bacterium]|nr:amidohydrolase family protein [Alphaproteobacteria bacterium]
MILRNGRVITLDREDRVVDAVGFAEGRIVAAGAADAVAAAMAPGTPALDLGGRAVVPGLIDGHAHMDREGLKLALPSLAAARSVADVVEIVAALARRAAPGDWIVTMPLGRPPDFAGMPEGLREGRWPDRHDLDRAAPHNPVYIRSIWGYWRHTLPLVSIANSRALALCGIDRGSVPPAPTVEIARDAAGEPTGVFVERHFMPLVELGLMAKAPGFDVAARADALRRSMRIYNGFGTTSVFEGHGVAADVAAAYGMVRTAGAQTVRAHLVHSPAWSLLGPDGSPAAVLRGWLKWLAGRGFGDEWLRLSAIYAEIDESPENRLRARALPQTGWAGFNYDAGLPAGATRELLLEAARCGVRAVGIWPNMLDLFAEVDRAVPIAGRRWVLGHIAVLTPVQVAAIRDLGLVVTTHTNRYVWKEGVALRDRLGAAAAEDIVPLRGLLDAGVPVSLATDNVPPTLFAPIWHAVARRARGTGEVIAPGQRLTRLEALRCASLYGAHLTFEEDEKGSIAPGKRADLAVLTRDPLGVDEDRLATIVAEQTIVDGRIVYRRGDPDPSAPPRSGDVAF